MVYDHDDDVDDDAGDDDGDGECGQETRLRKSSRWHHVIVPPTP